MLQPSQRTDAVESSGSGTDPSYEMPETSKNSPQGLNKVDIQENSMKRKRASLQAPRSRWKRLKAHYNDKYRELYNETVNELIHAAPLHPKELLSPSQIGVTLWSSQEKEAFFTSLARKGRGDLPGIASAIGTKNELEVHVYLKLLQNEVVQQHLHNRRNQLFDVSVVPGALEVSSACSTALGLSAEALGILQQRAEARFEKKKHHDMWLLDQKLGRWASSCLNQGARGEKEIRGRLPAAELLDLEVFLTLSRNIFMNSSNEDEHWLKYCSGKEQPSILCTAFGDYHRLTVSITRRLVQSSLFFAMSRRKAATTSIYTPKQAVRKQDIAAALDVLGMKHNSRMFWTGVAKRCALMVYDGDIEDIQNAPLSLSEVEKRLSQGGIHSEDGDEYDDLNADDTDEDASTESSSFSASFSADGFNNSDHTSNHFDGYASSASSGSSSKLSRVSNQDLDIYAEALDAKASLDEEKRLWEVLDEQPPEPLSPDDIVVPRVPNGERKTGDDLDDWRAWTDFAPEWETYTKKIPEVSFTENHRDSGRKEMGKKRN